MERRSGLGQEKMTSSARSLWQIAAESFRSLCLCTVYDLLPVLIALWSAGVQVTSYIVFMGACLITRVGHTYDSHVCCS